MRVRGGLLLLVATSLVSGCAGQQYSQQLNQLKSDVGLLDQRVGQLERSSLTPPSASAWPTEPQAQVSTATVPVPTEPPKASSVPMLKPTKKEIQQALKNAGFYQGAVDGKLGPKTREAIKEFQRTNGVKADGVVGKRTWEKLAPYLEKAPAQSASSGEVNATAPLK